LAGAVLSAKQNSILTCAANANATNRWQRDLVDGSAVVPLKCNSAALLLLATRTYAQIPKSPNDMIAQSTRQLLFVFVKREYLVRASDFYLL